MRRICFSFLALALCFTALAQAQPVDLGRIDFPNSGAEAAQTDFLEGVLFLHSFEYDDAAAAFRRAQEADPTFALAYWGEAMTYNRPIWNQRMRDQALAALGRLAPSPEARRARTQTDREKAYLRAIDVLFADGEKPERDAAYADAMADLVAAYPNDLEAQAFYALAILGTAQGERDFATYMRAAAVADAVFEQNPKHPGAAHYLIHAFDDPIHAPLGLPAARVYADIAPAAAHALHMPSHIFLALGMWDAVIASNIDSWEAADARRERQGLGLDDRNYHALWWLIYGYLQQGRVDDARATLSTMEADARASGSRRTRYHLAMMRAAYLVETRDWEAAPLPTDFDLTSVAPAATHFAEGLRAVETGDAATARDHLKSLRSEAEGDGLSSREAEVMALELEARLALAEDRGGDAVAAMERATALEEKLPFGFGPPVPVKPTHELFGEILLELGRPADAQRHFERSLARSPRRALSLLGLARAATEAGDEAAAAEAHMQLRDMWNRKGE